MDNNGARTPIAELPAEDGALDRALAEVNARLTTWLAAMSAALRAVQNRAADATPERPPAAIADVSVEPARAASAVGPPADSTADVVAGAPEAAATPEATLPDTRPPETDPARAGALMSAEVTRESSLTDLPAPGDGPSGEPARSVTSEQTGAANDEQLLALLDEQTQAAIRVKRRLFGNQKSVRELLDEMSRPEPGQQTTKPQPKRWWRRRSS